MAKLLSIVLYPFSVILLLASLIVIVGIPSLFALPFNWQTRRNMTGPFWKIFAIISLKGVCLARIYREDHREKEIQKKGSPEGLYIANHQSFLDIPMMLTKIQVPPIMKKEVLYIPFLGICAYSSGAIIVDRKDPESRRKVFQVARDRLQFFDKSLQYYPEGTRQKRGQGPRSVSELKKPLMKFAFDKKIKIYPISIYGTRNILFSKMALVHYGTKIGSIFHEAVDPNDFSNADEFMEVAWNKVISGYDELQKKLT